MNKGVTISQAAAFAGITVKTVRHYHKHGLVEEPRRDGSGYRRYGPAELLRLVQVRTLAAAGVPLAEIGPMLDADAAQFAAAIADVERRLTERIEDLIARRDMLHRLADGDGVLLPDRVRAFLDRLPDFGLSAEIVAEIRDGLVLARALVPEGFDDYLTRVERALGDTRFVELSKRSLEAAAWAPDDPRIEELATATAEHFLANPGLLAILTSLQGRSDDAEARYGMIKRYGHDRALAWARLTKLFEQKLRAAGVSIPTP
ncbi:DNA-binding transcriptional regulator, MerR family [Nannocystis exedens]|uniref:DNA-binding transcriptional regulator, MerR family n=1 Tax=Nannocystis exedens TaxID=54 RepID=A0A1I2IGU0_9BACT|nr:MerR family transcriptional regulator [Nannocystis exedens]PCC73674.1 MerR family transcriptional regulator [Nannocystis exedens]SFF40883.1 DNA-binding transcriptional regulator, MerR family [Nannocystis exedens]